MGTFLCNSIQWHEVVSGLKQVADRFAQQLNYENRAMYNEVDFLKLAACHYNPTDLDIELATKRDRNANPYNDAHLPKLRTRDEIIIDLKWAFAKALLSKAP